MNGHIVAPFRRRPGLFHLPQPAPACLVGLGRSPDSDQLQLAIAAYLARFKGASRYHTESDLRCYLAWCVERGLDPLSARRPHLELYIRWMHHPSGWVRRY